MSEAELKKTGRSHRRRPTVFPGEDGSADLARHQRTLDMLARWVGGNRPVAR